MDSKVNCTKVTASEIKEIKEGLKVFIEKEKKLSLKTRIKYHRQERPI